ncbi:T9SS type A sorting domain-containing protein [Flavobacterium sp.]|uniref:T9SS type A sorting domain-containing protein n=1 Tax=Flavobacterium sp. TaxID=239 RepID=UPI0038FD019E
MNVELKNQNTENIKVELFDSLGKNCKNESFSSAQIKISTADLASGIYVVKITADNQIAVKKFIKP